MSFYWALSEQLGVPKKEIQTISPMHKWYYWVIKFRENYKASDLFGKELKFEGESVIIEDYNKPVVEIKYNTYRIAGGNHDNKLDDVRDFVINKIGVDVGTDDDEIRIVKCEFELLKYTDFDIPNRSKEDFNVLSGSILMTISYKENISKDIKNISGTHDFKGQDVNIIQFGVDFRKCFGCKESGHLIANCPSAKETCINCKRLGHKKCSFADKVNGPIESFPHNDDNFVFDETQATRTNQTTILETNGGDQLNSSLNINSIADIQKLNGNIMNENSKNNLGKPTVKRRQRSSPSTSLNSTTSPIEENKLKKKVKNNNDNQNEYEEEAEYDSSVMSNGDDNDNNENGEKNFMDPNSNGGNEPEEN